MRIFFDYTDCVTTRRGRTPQYVTDPKAWRALAHPVRMRLLHELGRLKKARAADLAEALDEPANSVSFHLRQLARYGLIEPAEDPDGDRRAKWWQVAVTDPALQLDEDNDSPQSRRALRDVVEVMRSTNHELVDDFIDAVSALEEFAAPSDDNEVEPTNWDLSFDLTRQEWTQLKVELREVLDRWRERSTPGTGRQTYRHIAFGARRQDLDAARSRRGVPPT